jgi:hypothetical protein
MWWRLDGTPHPSPDGTPHPSPKLSEWLSVHLPCRQVFTFSEELCERLDEAAERQLRDDSDVPASDDDADGAGASRSSTDEDEEQVGSSESQLERSARLARRSAESDQRDRVAGELRQQALHEVLVLQQAHRPDTAPLARPRRAAAAQPWSREQAWEAVRQQSGQVIRQDPMLEG